jgi:menaquinone-9 beta-reductase
LESRISNLEFEISNPASPSAAVIGAGPAGSIAAYSLASRGWQVTLIEQHRFPRDKVCGECLSALGIAALERLGLSARIRALHPVILTRAALHAHDGASATLDMPAPIWGLSRIALDTSLLDAARQAGGDILQPARCESLNGTLAVRDLGANTLRQIGSDWTLLADGKAALLPARPIPTGDLGIKAHFDQVEGPRDAIELFGVTGHYIGLAPVENNRWNVAFSMPAAKLRQLLSMGERVRSRTPASSPGQTACSRLLTLSGLDAVWSFLLTENPTLADRFKHARRVSDWLTSPLPRFAVLRDWPERVIPLGNAAAALEPISGEGMGLAIQSAALAASTLEECRQSGRPFYPRGLARQFDRLWRPRRAASRALARVLSSPGIASAALDWARASESLTRAVTAWMGKSPAAL